MSESSMSTMDPLASFSRGSRPRHLRSNEIVLLEEADLYRVRSTTSTELTATASHSIQLTLPPPPPPPPQSVGSRSDRRAAGHPPSHRGDATAYLGMSQTPYTIGTKRTASSIDTIPAHYGAIRPGGPVDLLSRDYVGLLFNWFLVGFFNGSFPALLTPLFITYLHYEDSRADSVLVLFSLGWYVKFVFGFLSDCVPINRQRRKPYMFIGWTLFGGLMLALACIDKVEPYMQHGEVYNEKAPTQGARYVLPIMVASLAHLLATAACEGMTVELAHREGEFDRGQTQLRTLMARFSGELVGGLFVSLGCQGQEYGGTFAASLPLDWVFGVLAFFALLGVVATRFLLSEEGIVTSRQRLASQMRHVWRILEQRATWQVMAFGFLFTFATSMEVNEKYMIQVHWLHYGSLTQPLATAIGSAVSVVVTMAISRWMLNANWRHCIATSVVVSVLLMLPVRLLTAFDVKRDVYLWVPVEQVSAAIAMVNWILPLLLFVEIAEPGYEATCYDLLTTLCNVGAVVMSTTQSLIAAGFSKEAQDIAGDSRTARWHVATQNIVIAVLTILLTLAVMPLLPQHKRHLKEIKARGSPNLVIPIVLCVVFLGLFLAAFTSKMLAVFESTACLRFAGGPGCGKSDESG
ncbi:hypothetical protein PINS_up000860 [Pythium insidiosum]|nr:hypothetical protein PINS_up000860 [Pythium insidiosum]